MKLLKPSIEYKQQVLEYKKEFIENGDDLAAVQTKTACTAVMNYYQALID